MKGDLEIFLETMGFISVILLIAAGGFYAGHSVTANLMVTQYTKVPYCEYDDGKYKCFKVVEVKQ